jgi:hypothetical protein
MGALARRVQRLHRRDVLASTVRVIGAGERLAAPCASTLEVRPAFDGFTQCSSAPAIAARLDCASGVRSPRRISRPVSQVP